MDGLFEINVWSLRIGNNQGFVVYLVSLDGGFAKQVAVFGSQLQHSFLFPKII